MFRSRIVYADTSTVGTSLQRHVFGGGGWALVRCSPSTKLDANGSKARCRRLRRLGALRPWHRPVRHLAAARRDGPSKWPAAPILQGQGLASLEIHATPKLDIYLYGGVEYNDRNAFATGVKGSGYGSPLLSNAGCETELPPTSQYVPLSGTCNADTRALWQGVGGFWYRFYRAPTDDSSSACSTPISDGDLVGSAGCLEPAWSGHPAEGDRPNGLLLVPVLSAVTADRMTNELESG